MADLVPLQHDAEWVSEIHERQPGELQRGGPPDLALDRGLANVQAQQLAARTAWSKQQIDTMEALIAGLTDQAALLGAMRVFPEVESADNRLTFTAGSAQVAVGAGQSWIWRGGRRLRSDELGTRTVAVTPGTTQLVYWDAPGTGTAVPAASHPAGRLTVTTPASEADPIHDSSFDRMLVAQVVTSAAGAPTVTPLANAARLTAVIERGGPMTTDVNDNGANTTLLFLTDWGRTPSWVLPTFSTVNVGTPTTSDMDQSLNENARSRYRTSITGLMDGASSIAIKGAFYA
jgi:hypothetical protein